jgi:hypothetical protein
MNRFRLLRAAGIALLAAIPAMVHAQDESAPKDFDYVRAMAMAREQARTELEEIYAQGQLKLAPPWRGLSVEEDAAVFVRSESPPGIKGQASVWVDRELPVPGYFEKEKPYVSVRERFVADCSGRRLGLAESVYYSGRYGSGALVTHDRNAQPEMKETLPDSLEEQIRSAACPKPAPKPAPKPKKKAVKPKPDDGKAQAKKDTAKDAAKAAPKEAKKKAKKEPKKEIPKKNATSQVKKDPFREAKLAADRDARTLPRRPPPPAIKKPAPEEEAGKATTTAGRR